MNSENRKWYSLYDKVYAKENLIEAWKKVKANKGKPGYDRESIEEFAKDEMRNLAEIHRLLWVILCKLERKAERALEVAKQILEGQLKLTIHPEKTRIVHFRQGFDFLGCRFRFRYVTPKPKSLLKFKERVRQLTARHRGKNLKQVLAELAPVIRGWGDYHRRYNNKTRFEALDQWIRMRLRCFLEKKKAVKHQNRRIPSQWLEAQGHVTLCSRLA